MDPKRTKRFVLFVLAELAWGTLFALFLQHTRPGRYLARNNQSWLAVVIGVTGTQIIELIVSPLCAVCASALAFALSAVGIVTRSLINEHKLERTLHDAAHTS